MDHFFFHFRFHRFSETGLQKLTHNYQQCVNMNAERIAALQSQLEALKSANRAEVNVKISEITAIGDELNLVNSDIEMMESDERKCRRRLHLVVSTAPGSGGLISASPVGSGVSSAASEKNLVENILTSLLEFNEPRSKRR